jgi:type II secretory pathway pseudopilin PulG
MLNWKSSRLEREDGDTLIEVTFALAILGSVILSCTALMTSAFKTGQTARERTQVSEVAQEQLEALRSFRDNHTWTDFQNGSAGFSGINTVAAGFHMELKNTGLGNEWVPVLGALTSGGSSVLQVPTSQILINTTTGTSACGYNFLLKYNFAPIGSNNVNDAHGQIQTELVNLKFSGGSPCP